MPGGEVRPTPTTTYNFCLFSHSPAPGGVSPGVGQSPLRGGGGPVEVARPMLLCQGGVIREVPGPASTWLTPATCRRSARKAASGAKALAWGRRNGATAWMLASPEQEPPSPNQGVMALSRSCCSSMGSLKT